LERAAEATNALNADLVVFTGDLVDASQETIAPAIDFVQRLDGSRLAMCQGNHDGMRGIEWFEPDIMGARLPLLLDETMTFRVPGRRTPVQMMGITWGEPRLGRDVGQVGKMAARHFRIPTDEWTADTIKRVAAAREPGAFPILLAHHPHALDPAADAGLPLILSGHTHGGQIMLTRTIGAGPLRFKYWQGEYARGDSRLFVNRGIGNWFPLRVNAPAEIVKLKLRRA
jgi:predicted MPP superfamily phosphohydrolase